MKHSSSTAGIWLRIASWAVLLALSSVWLGRTTHVDTDLRLFLPKAESPAERILLAQLKEGPGTRLLLASLSGADRTQLAQASDQLVTTLRNDAPFSTLFTRVENGSLHADEALEQLATDYRYLLTPDAPALDAASLHDSLQQRLLDLSSPAGSITQDWLLRDPTGALDTLIEHWQGTSTPQLIDGVWFDTAGQRALLLLQTTAPGFDAEQQRAALTAIEQALRRADPQQHIKLEITGPGAFTALLEAGIRSDVTTLSITEGIASFLFLLLVLWSWRHVLLGSLTLATAGAAALLGVMLLFPSVHGITLAFGFTLLGVAMDYPVHLILHLDPQHSPRDTLRSVWPTLRLSIVTTCIAYAALALAGFTGLAQLGCFTVCGLLATALVIRFVLPSLTNVMAARRIPGWVIRVQQAPRLRALPLLVIVVAGVALLTSRHPLWNNELSSLTPVPQALQDLDTELRAELGAPDLRYVIAVTGRDTQTVLQRDESLRPGLTSLVTQGVLDSFEQPSSLLPSVAAQQARQAALPETGALSQQLTAALAGLPFRSDAFDAFVTDVQRTRTLAPLTADALTGTPLAERFNATVFNTGSETVALITLSHVQQLAQLQQWTAAAGNDVLLLDLKGISEQLVERFRTRALIALGLALVVIAVLMLWQLTPAAAMAVLLPVIATLLAEVALFNVMGVSLTLFHIVSLLLVGGLCFDYGLFFNRSEHSDSESLRTRFAVMACWLSTTGAFALLLMSQLPVLRAIGSTVALGVTLGFMIALFARSDTSPPTA